jgi:hypothetical protein
MADAQTRACVLLELSYFAHISQRLFIVDAHTRAYALLELSYSVSISQVMYSARIY